MPSHNESIPHHPNKACLGSIIARTRCNLGLLIGEPKSAIPHLTSMFRRSRVPIDEKIDVEVTPTSYNEIQTIEVLYLRNKADKIGGYILNVEGYMLLTKEIMLPKAYWLLGTFGHSVLVLLAHLLPPFPLLLLLMHPYPLLPKPCFTE